MRCRGAGAPHERIARVRAELLVCDVECIPASLALERRLDADGAAMDAERVRALFADAAGRVPLAPAAFGIELDATLAAGARSPGDPIGAELTVRPCPGTLAAPASLPARPPSSPIAAVAMALTPGSVMPDRRRGLSRVARGRRRRDAAGAAHRRARPASTARARRAPSRWTSRSGRPPRGEARIGLARALVLALLGGLVLNLMPCVLPVLALKAVSVFLNAVTKATDWSRSGMSLGVSVGAVMAALSTPVVGMLVDRYGVRVPMTAGVVLLAVGFAILMGMHEPWHFVAANVALGPGFAACALLPITVAVTILHPGAHHAGVGHHRRRVECRGVGAGAGAAGDHGDLRLAWWVRRVGHGRRAHPVAVPAVRAAARATAAGGTRRRSTEASCDWRRSSANPVWHRWRP